MNETNEKLLEKLRSVAVWSQGAERAPHKPLLLLLSLASVQRGEDRLTPYNNLHEHMERLLLDFGPPRQSQHPEYPFWRLQNDGEFWEVPEREAAIEARGERLRTGDVPPSVLRSLNARGGFSLEVFEQLRREPSTVNEIAAAILDEHFPPSLHESILDSVGMPWTAEERRRSQRSPEFREEVVRLYEHQCAMCGFDGRLGVADLALEAAHIRWHALGGPDHPTNGLLLCSIHHQALDRGAVGLTEDHTIVVSQHLHGGAQVDDIILRLGGAQIRRPIDPAASPATQFILWHQQQVFRAPARPVP